MYPFYREFISYLDKKDREKCVNSVVLKLSNHEIDIITLYYEILSPALRERFCNNKKRAICVWEEHVRSSIVRTVIECCYPYVIKERNEKYGAPSRGSAIVVCPTEEYHEIGARMIADFFTLNGFDSYFIGANTPQDDILQAIDYVKPVYIAISTTNYYNLVAARNTIGKIREIKRTTRASFKIIVGGLAFQQNPSVFREMGADMLLDTFEDIRNLAEAE